MTIAGIGDIVIKRDGDKVEIVENVIYVSGIKCNLLSVGQS